MDKFVWIFIGVGLPLIASSLIAHLVHLPEYTRRVAIVVFTMVIAVAGLFPISDSFRPGIDLSGGTILVYQVQKPLPVDFDQEKMVSAIYDRINPAGLMDVTIRGIGSDQVEIIIPRAKQEDVARCKKILTSVGSLEFRILANRRDHKALITAAESSFPQPVRDEGKAVARWLPVAKSAGVMGEYGEIVIKADQEQAPLVLVVDDELDVTGELLRRSESTVDEMGRPAVGFHFNARGARLFGTLTEMNLPDPDGFERRLAIVLDGRICSAPGIRDRISENGIITGSFSSEEVEDLVTVLNAGSLPASLETAPASEFSIGPTLGRDTIESGMTAMIVSTAAVLIFIAAWYRLAGVIANLAVIFNVLIVVGVMSWVHATWTLPGLAGLALSVGMAVDANVLIFERLREEQQRGRSLKLAVEYAFDRALRPILDSNVTTLLAGLILYWIGSDQIRGFALTLLIGLLANLFTAVFVCRLVFDILQRNAWVKRFGMLEIFKNARFDFVGKRWVAVIGSSLLILAGAVAVASRGKNLLDIDFTGGTLAAITFEEPTDSATVRKLAGNILPDVAVEELQLNGQAPGRHYLVRTTLQDQEAVKTGLVRTFEGMKMNPVFERLENFGSQVARQTQAMAGLAMLASMAAIVIYLWIRFQNVLFGMGAVIALAHDVLVVVGLMALSHYLAGTALGNWLGLESFKINLPMIAALMTLVGYSVNDTIVVFDRIREIRRTSQRITWEMINSAVNQTLSRTLLTGLTTWIVALILYVFGGAAIHAFAFCLVLGVLVGTYSSVYVASPLLVWLSRAAVDRPPASFRVEAQPAGAPQAVSRSAGSGNRSGKKHRKVA